jgi:hypothetical protein
MNCLFVATNISFDTSVRRTAIEWVASFTILIHTENVIAKENKMTEYNGWKNRQTWNVALWIDNDENLYKNAVRFMSVNPDKRNPYRAFCINYGLAGDKTPDGIAYMGTRLDYKALNAFMLEFRSDR